MTVSDVRKWKSVLLERAPDDIVETKMSHRSKLVEGIIVEFKAHTLIDYYWGQRTVVAAWALSGNYEVDSKDIPGTKVTMMPADEAMGYADRGLRLASRTLGSDREQLDWWHRKDVISRTLMVNYVRDKYPAGEALKHALKECAQDWTIVKQSELVGQHDSIVEAAVGRWDAYTPWSDHAGHVDEAREEYQDQRPTRQRGNFADKSAQGKKSGRGKGKGGKQGKQGKSQIHSVVGKIATTTRQGERLCGAFNSKKGCRTATSCPQSAVHQCGGIVKPDGTVCFSKNHGASQHRH